MRNKTLFIVIVIMLVIIVAGVLGGIAYKKHHKVGGGSDMWPARDLKAGSPYSSKYEGVDISANQGVIHWDDVSKNRENLKFVYLRVFGFDEMIDAKYTEYIKELKKLNIPFGTYLFFSMRKPALEQYSLFHKLVNKDKQILKPVIDVENESLSGADPTHLKDSVMVIAKLLEKEYGTKPIIYSNESHYKDYLAPEFNNFPLWIANYSNKPNIGKAKPILWQYSKNGHVHGIWTNVDLDRFINGGTLNDLKLN